MAEILRLEVDGAARGNDVAVLVGDTRKTVVVQTVEAVGEQGTVRIAHLCETVAYHHLDDVGTRLQVGDLRGHVGKDEVGLPREVFLDNVLSGNAQLGTVGLHISHISHLADSTADARHVDRADKVVVLTTEPVELHIDAVSEETDAQTEVQLVLLLVGQLFVGNIFNLQTRLLDIGKGTIGLEVLHHDGGIADPQRSGVGSQRVAGLQRQVRQGGAQTLEELLLVGIPRSGDVPGR